MRNSKPTTQNSKLKNESHKLSLLKTLNMKTKLITSLILVILSGYAIPGVAQLIKSKSLKPASYLKESPPFRAWLLEGNDGTDPAINFVGTSDAQPLVFRVNNQRSGLIDYDDFSQSTAFGYQTLINNIPSDVDGNTGGIGNSAFGYQALMSNISGELNTGIGQLALAANTEGNINTAVGSLSLFQNTTGGFNTAIGSISLSSNTEGSFNTAIGDFALDQNTTGSFNMANGTPFTLALNSEGSENIAAGGFSMANNSTGNANSAYGVFSLASNETGNNNTALGAQADVSAGDLNNATAIGAGALVDASNKVRIGNTDVTSIGGEVGWTSYSDERIKDNIRENVPGLEFIKALRPVTYHFSVSKQNKLLGIKSMDANKMMSELKDFKMPGIQGVHIPRIKIPEMKIKNIAAEQNHEIEKVQFTGFLAQDVEKAANNIGYDFSGIDKSGKIMGLRYSDFVVPLVKAVQELSKQNEELQKQITELREMMNTNAKSNVKLSNLSLEQNNPNPFTTTTTINYTLPQAFSNAQIVISDASGKILKRVPITGRGKGTVNIDATTLSPGAYNYALLVDNQLISTKQMILGK